MAKSPFKFLDSYTREDREIFFGRDQEITELYRRVFESKILLVYGISGTGKSSLINCGLASRFDDSDWLPVNVRRGSNIVDSLNEAFNKQAIRLLKNKMSVAEKLQSIYLDHFKPVYLIFDQFEELFIFGTNEEKSEFIKLIKEVVKSETQSKILFIIREEFLAGITEFEYDLPEIFSNRFRVEKMKRANAISAVEGPCKAYNIKTEQGFSEILIDKLSPAGNEIELTYLQIYLDRIFNLSASERNEGKSPEFTKEILERAGSVSDLLGQFLDEQIRGLNDPETGMSILKSFISVHGTKRQMSEPEIKDSVKAFETDVPENELIKMLEKFVDLRILRERDESGHFELRHDALAAKIYEKFTALEKDIIEVRQFIENAFSTYEKRGKLLSSDDLKYIAPYEDKLYLSKLSEAFIAKSKNEIMRARRRRRTVATVAGIALILVLSGFTIWAINERRKAVREREIAELQKEKALTANEKATAAEADALREKNRALENEQTAIKAKDEAENSRSKALRAEELAQKEKNRALENESISIKAKKEAELSQEHAKESEQAALKSKEIADQNFLKAKANSLNYLSQKIVETDPTIALRLAENAVRLDSENHDNIENLNRIYYDNNFYNIVYRFGRSISGLITSPNGKYLMATLDNRTAYLLDNQGKVLRVFAGNGVNVRSAAFSPDSRNILTCYEKSACLWDLEGNILREFTVPEGTFKLVAFSPDGKYILTGSEYVTRLSTNNSYVTSGDNYVRIWDVRGNVIQVLKGGNGNITSFVFSPDGKYILTGSNDWTPRLWDLQGNVLKIFKGHNDFVTSVAFSPDGKSILTGSMDKSARLWDLHGNILHVFKGHGDRISSLIFSHDGMKILTGSYDGTACLWDLQGSLLQLFIGHEKDVLSVLFSPDDNSILTASNDKTIRRWDLQENLLHVFKFKENMFSSLSSLAFSPQSQSILTGTYDGIARLWDLKGNLIQEFKGHKLGITSTAFSPDGKNILTGSNDWTARLWDLKGNTIHLFTGHEVEIRSVAFSPDGKNIMTGSGRLSSKDNTIRIWDLQGTILKVIQGLGRPVYSVAFSPDSKKILTRSLNSALLWDLDGSFKTIASSCSSVAFSPDGNAVLIGSTLDYIAYLYDLQGNVLQSYKGHKGYIGCVAFSPDGTKILTGSSDKTARLWDVNGNLLQILTGHDGSVNKLAFSPDGKMVLTGDITARLWNIKKTPEEFKRENNYQELSIAQQLRYGLLDYSGILKLGNEKSILEVGEFYFQELNFAEKNMKIEYQKNALNLFSLLVEKFKKPKYVIRLLNIYEYLSKTSPSEENNLKIDSLRNYIDNHYIELLSSKDPEELLIGASYYTTRGATISDRKTSVSNYQKSLDLYEKVRNDFPENGIGFSLNYCSNLSHALLFVNQFKDALKYAQKGKELSKDEFMTSDLDLALGYLFNNQYAEVLKIIENNKKTTLYNMSFAEYIISKLDELEKEGITCPDAKKLKEELQK